VIFARFLLAVAAAYLAQLLGLALTPHFPRAVAPFLLVVVWFSMRTSPVLAQLLGASCGLVEDALTGGLFGLHAFADTLVAYGVALAAQRVVVGQQAVRVLLFAGAAVVQQLVIGGLLLAMLDDPPLPTPGFALLKVATTALLGAVLISMESQARTQWSAWQRRRSRQLRFR
jgi:rod shape-determining protein MreD